MKKYHTNWKGIMPLTLLIGGLLFCLPTNCDAQDADKYVRAGNKLYKDSSFTAAEDKYNKALEVDPNSEKGLFNQGNAYYQQEKYEEALQNYEMIAELMLTPKEKAAAYHNLGNVHFQNQKYEESIDAYKNALRQNPTDVDTKYNLVLAKKMLEQQQQQEQDQNQDQDQDQENQDDKNQDQQDKEDSGDQNQDQEDGEGNEEQQKDGDQNQGDQPKDQEQGDGNKDQGKEGQEEGKEQPMPKASKLTKEEVERFMEILQNDENKVQEKIIKKKIPPSNKKSEKEW